MQNTASWPNIIKNILNNYYLPVFSSQHHKKLVSISPYQKVVYFVYFIKYT